MPLLRPFGTSFGTVNGGVKAGIELLLHFGGLSKRRFRQCFGFGVPCLGSLPALPVHDDFSFGIGLGGKRQIGRASGRERVCQYVEISVVAVSLKKKSKNRCID